MKQDSPGSIKCSMCGRMQTAITDAESAEVVCNNCGMVVSDKTTVDSQKDWRALSTEEMESRVRGGTPSSLSRHDKGLSTIIGRPNIDAAGKKLDSNTLWARRRTEGYSELDRDMRKKLGKEGDH